MLRKSIDMSAEEKKAIIRDADDMLNGIFIFDGIWDMEPCSTPIENKEISWTITNNGDNEWTFMFVRMDYLYKFIVAYEVTGDKKYLRHGLRIINKWYHDNKKYVFNELEKPYRFLFQYKNNNWLACRSLDMAIMNTNIVDFVLFCKEKGVITDKALKQYKRIVINNILCIEKYSDGDRKAFSNWGIIENGNIIYCLCKLKSSIKYSEILSRLVRQVNNQIIYNGSQIESSPMYLVQILLVLLRILNCSSFNAHDELIIPTIKGCEYIASIRKLNNCIPNIGDSDLSNISDLMIVAAYVLKNDTFLQYVDRRINIEYAVKYDIPRDNNMVFDLIHDYNKLITYKDQTIYRSYNTKSYVLCSNILRRVDGHKHYDYLSVLYSEYGKDILVDLGRFSYKNDQKRIISIGPSAHNVICVADNSFYKPYTSWVTKQRIDTYDNEVIEGNNWINVKMSCVLGYSEVKIYRYVTYIFQKGLVITDIVIDKKDREYITYFNIGLGFDIILDESFFCIQDCQEHQIKMYYNNNSNAVAIINKVMYSTKYNEENETNQIALKTNQKNVTHCFLREKEKIATTISEESIVYSFEKSGKNICISR